MDTNPIGALSKLVSGDRDMPVSAAQRSAQLPSIGDVQAQRYQGISDQFKEGGLTPLTAILKGVTGQVAASKSEKAQAERDHKQKFVDDMIQWEAGEAKHRAEVEQMMRSEVEMRRTGTQLAQGIDQASVGDDTGVRNWFASNPETAKMMSARLGVPVESATFSNINGVDVLIPFGRDQSGNLVTGEAMPVDSVLKAYAPDAYAARYATRQAEAVAAKEAQLTEAQIATEQARAANYASQAENRGAPSSKPLPQGAVKLQDEAITSLSSLNALNADIDGLTAMIDSGNLDTGIVSRVGAKIRTAANSSTQKDRNLSTLDSKLEGLRNGILLMAKGVQTDGDALRAFNEIVNNKNDTALVRQRLQDIKVQNERNATLQQARIDSLRNEYGKEPMDYTTLQNQPSAVGTGQSTESSSQQYREGQTATNPQTGQKLTFRNGKWQ